MSINFFLLDIVRQFYEIFCYFFRVLSFNELENRLSLAPTMLEAIQHLKMIDVYDAPRS